MVETGKTRILMRQLVDRVRAIDELSSDFVTDTFWGGVRFGLVEQRMIDEDGTPKGLEQNDSMFRIAMAGFEVRLNIAWRSIQNEVDAHPADPRWCAQGLLNDYLRGVVGAKAAQAHGAWTAFEQLASPMRPSV